MHKFNGGIKLVHFWVLRGGVWKIIYTYISIWMHTKNIGKYIFILYDAAILLTAAVTTLKNLSKHKYIVYFPNKEFKCILTYLHIHIHTCIQIKIFKSSVAFPIRLCFVCKVFFFLYSWLNAWLPTKYIRNGSFTFEPYAIYVNLCTFSFRPVNRKLR